MSLIEDGTGLGYFAQVDSTNKLLVRSVARSRFNDVSEADGRAFRMVSDFMTIAATTRTCVFYFKNTSAVRHFHVENFYVSWNGGSTNYNRPLKAELRGGVAEPSANNTSITAINLNSLSGVVGTDLTSYYWDGVGSGMTVASDGALAGSAFFGQGLSIVNPAGAILVGKDGSFGIFVESPEAGDCAVFVEGYYEDTNGV